jgi:hypothetical protein
VFVLLAGCSNKKYESLELKNKQLQHQIDSLTVLLEKQKQIADFQRKLADSAAVYARKQAQQLARQKQLNVKR